MNDTEPIEKLLFGALQKYGERKARGVDASVEAYQIMDVATVAVTELSALRQRIAELEGERDWFRNVLEVIRSLSDERAAEFARAALEQRS